MPSVLLRYRSIFHLFTFFTEQSLLSSYTKDTDKATVTTEVRKSTEQVGDWIVAPEIERPGGAIAPAGVEGLRPLGGSVVGCGVGGFVRSFGGFGDFDDFDHFDEYDLVDFGDFDDFGEFVILGGFVSIFIAFGDCVEC